MQKELKTDYTITTGTASIQSLFISFFIGLIYISLYCILWGIEGLKPAFDKFMHYYSFIPIFICGVVVHELLHGITWKIFGKVPLRMITFGFRSKSLTPNCCCTIPIKTSAYKIGLLVPFLLMGLIPAIIGIAYNTAWLLFFGKLFSFVGSVDLLVFWNIFDLKSETLVQDSPVKAGCTLVE
ncbi:MAG: DUF3267 domain-containing protein [FCB group bacterium]